MPKRVRTIPASISQITAAPLNSAAKRKVAAYARVSTDHEEQLTSYEAQIDYYTNYIKQRDDWEFAGLYADEGITACNTKHRSGFNSMVQDALDGKIDLIITKSVSRFARNTVDSLTTIRKLKENGTECYFEKENIWTFDGKGELLLTIMSSLAQEESRSISQNVTWGHRKRFQDGKASVAYSNFLGYDRAEGGGFKVNEEEAKVVRLIYELFLEGHTPFSIAKELTNRGIKTPMGKDKWAQSTVQSILQNEKYRGDALLQKTFTVDFLSKKHKRNEGEVPQYYVEGSHQAIVSPHIFEIVQAEMKKRLSSNSKYSGISIFSSKICCGECGGWYGAKVWHSNDKYRRVVYQCNNKYKKKDKVACRTPHLTEEQIKRFFITAVNQVITEKEELIDNLRLSLKVICDNSALEKEKRELEDEMTVVAELTEKCVDENAHIAQNQAEYKERYDGLVARYDKAKANYEAVSDKIRGNMARQQELERFIEILSGQEPVTEFDGGLWASLVEGMTVNSPEDIVITFRDGTEVQVGTEKK